MYSEVKYRGLYAALKMLPMLIRQPHISTNKHKRLTHAAPAQLPTSWLRPKAVVRL
jgi:hypothetical protein